LPQINPHKDFLSFDKAENSMSLSQLEYNFDQIAFEASSINPERTFIYTDLELNNNVLYFFNSGINNSEFIKATEPYNPKIIYENSSPASQNITQLRRDFNSRNLKIKLLRHCYNRGITNNVFFYAPWRSDSSSGLLIGPMVYHMTNPHDFGIIDFVGKDVVPTFSVRNDVAAAYIELTITDSAPVSSVGAHVCKSGRTTYFTCGYVLGLNGRSYGNVDGIKKDLIISDMTSRRGDSGGTVLSFVSPQNLNSVVVQGIIYGGGILLHAAQSIDIIFKEIRENTIYDLTLYTG
ncbi:11077_t:CDS:2, partial [Gigaspora margarita]